MHRDRPCLGSRWGCGSGDLIPKVPSAHHAMSKQVAQGIIWVWGEAGRDAQLESALSPPPLVPELADKELMDSGRVSMLPLTQRDLPYGWDTLMENFVVRGDPPFFPRALSTYLVRMLSLLLDCIHEDWVPSVSYLHHAFGLERFLVARPSAIR